MVPSKRVETNAPTRRMNKNKKIAEDLAVYFIICFHILSVKLQDSPDPYLKYPLYPCTPFVSLISSETKTKTIAFLFTKKKKKTIAFLSTLSDKMWLPCRKITFQWFSSTGSLLCIPPVGSSDPNFLNRVLVQDLAILYSVLWDKSIRIY